MSNSIMVMPSPNMFRSMHRRKMTWRAAISELIDNSLDWGATEIRLTWSRQANSFSITDNGAGCSDLSRMVRYAEKTHGNDDRIGRYGIGLKDVSIWLWGQTVVVSNDGQFIRSACLNWEKLSSKTDMKDLVVPESKVEATLKQCSRDKVPHGHGTAIRFEHIERNAPKNNDIERLAADLSFQYSPAIKDGKTITLSVTGRKVVQVPRFQFPELTSEIRKTVRVDARRSYNLAAGIVPEGCPNRYSGFSVAYKNRVLFTTQLPANGYSTANFFAYVALKGEWDLSAHKDSLNDGEEMLYASLHDECKDLLADAEKVSTTVYLNGVLDAVSDQLSEMIETVTGKEVRRHGTQTGTVQPTGSGRKRVYASKVNRNKSGTSIGKSFNPSKGIKLDWWYAGDAESFGKADLRSNTIILNADHPYIKSVREQGDTELLAFISANILAQYIAADNDRVKQYFQCIQNEEFLDASMALLARFSKELRQPEPAVVF